MFALTTELLLAYQITVFQVWKFIEADFQGDLEEKVSTVNTCTAVFSCVEFSCVDISVPRTASKKVISLSFS